MPRSEASKQYKRQYNARYKTGHYKRIPLEVTFEKYEQIKAAAEAVNEPVNTYIKNAIDQRMNGDS